MADVNELEAWLAHAEDDLSAAKILLKRKKPHLFASCFHAQQCAEKYLKALLIFKDVEFIKTHDLVMLNRLCEKNGVVTGFDETQLADLSKHAVQTRYPGNEPTIDETREAIDLAVKIREFARKFLGLKK